MSLGVAAEVREFLRRCPARVVGVTGTTGEHGAAALMARMLNEAGRRTWLGMAGRSPMEFMGRVKASELVVLELASEDLVDVDVSPHIAVCLAVESEDGLEQVSVRNYMAAKGNLFWHQRSD